MKHAIAVQRSGTSLSHANIVKPHFPQVLRKPSSEQRAVRSTVHRAGRMLVHTLTQHNLVARRFDGPIRVYGDDEPGPERASLVAEGEPRAGAEASAALAAA